MVTMILQVASGLVFLGGLIVAISSFRVEPTSAIAAVVIALAGSSLLAAAATALDRLEDISLHIKYTNKLLEQQVRATAPPSQRPPQPQQQRTGTPADFEFPDQT